MIRAIIFDCFGVLAEDGWSPFKRQYLADPEKALAVAKIGKAVDEGVRSYEDMITETARIANVSEQVVRTAVEHKVPNELLFGFITRNLKPRYKIGLLSNASYNVLKHLFSPEQVSIFNATALSYETGLVKPSTDMFHVIAQRLGVRPDECVLVDDQARHCAGAVAIGMQAIQYESVLQTEVALRKVLTEEHNDGV
jgi:HAD superfamily hydrolase (TIGR01509 family)